MRYFETDARTHLGDSFHQRLTSDLVLSNTDHGRRSFGSRGENSFDGFSTLESSENTIVSGRVSSTLSVTESRNTSVESEAVREDFFDIVGSDRVEFAVMSSFGYDDNGLSLSFFTVL